MYAIKYEWQTVESQQEANPQHNQTYSEHSPIPFHERAHAGLYLATLCDPTIDCSANRR